MLKHLAFRFEDSIGRRQALSQEEDAGFERCGGDPFALDIVKIMGSETLKRQEENHIFSGLTNGKNISRASYAKLLGECAKATAADLGLNANLAEAIAWQINLGHVAFGSEGKRFLKQKSDDVFDVKNFGFFLSDRMEALGEGLNVSYEVLMGSLCPVSFCEHSYYVLNGICAEAELVAYLDKIIETLYQYQATIHFFDGPSLDVMKNTADKIGCDHMARIAMCIKVLKEESIWSKRIAFRYSITAAQFGCLRVLLGDNSYHWASYRQGIFQTLENIYCFFLKLLRRQDLAVLAVGLINEDEAFSLSKLLGEKGYDYVLANFQKEIHFFAKRLTGIYHFQDSDFFHPDLSWAEQKKKDAIQKIVI